jgi:TRAP-type C4-dicarboxylate transport system substrate-binding protein
VDRGTWERIPEDLRPRLREIAEEIGEAVQTELLDWETNAIEEMTSAGLQVVEPTPESLAEWNELFEWARERLRGEVIPEAWYDEAIRVAGEGKGG